jgi:protein-L-isoaspartate O-methyltransferase
MSSLPYYNANASALVSQYESLAAESLHSWLVDLLPKNKNLALDVGAGSGRDAAWLASLSFEVVAVEPSAGMRNEARRLHESEKIQWLDDSLPDFRVTQRLGLSFDVILLSAGKR